MEQQHFQRRLHEVVAALMEQDPANIHDAIYQSVLSTFYSALEEGHLLALDRALRVTFPAYYDDPVPLLASEN